MPDVRDSLVVICSELPNNPGGSITNSAEVIAEGVIRHTGRRAPWSGMMLEAIGPRLLGW